MTESSPGNEQPLAGEKQAPPVEDLIGIVVTFTIVAALMLVFIQPWLPTYAPGGGPLNRYFPIRDGDSLLLAQVDDSGKAVSWQSQNRGR